MATNTNNVRLGFNSMDALYVSNTEIDLAYMGDDIIWGEVATSAVQWGPHAVFAVAGNQWLLFPALTTGDDIYDALGITGMVGASNGNLVSFS